MRINLFSVTFWFNIYKKFNDVKDNLIKELTIDFPDIKIFDPTDDLLKPLLIAENKEKKISLTISQINFQYNMHFTDFNSIKVFRDTSLQYFEMLSNQSFDILHSALYINGEFTDKNAKETLTKSLVSSKILTDDLIDLTLKFSKKYEDSFFKIISILNKKELRIPRKFNQEGEELPLNIVSWKGAQVVDELIEVSYEINDRYLFDNENNYHTSEFHLNKMLYLLENDFSDDLKNLISNGEF